MQPQYDMGMKWLTGGIFRITHCTQQLVELLFFKFSPVESIT